MKPKIKLTLKAPGDKSISVRMEWNVEGTGYTIVRHKPSSSTNASSVAQKNVDWFVLDQEGNLSRPPAAIHKHEVSIARWLISNTK